VNAAVAVTPAWTRAAIRARLAGERQSLPRGDVNTAMRLSDADNLTPYDAARFGPVTFSSVLPAQMPGAPGITTPRIPAAVLVPLVEYGDGFKILLTQRMADLKSHAGQISFPGGRIEPSDRDVEHGALREAEEEIGLPSSQVEILGRLDPYITVSGFEVMPVVGAITPPLSLKRDPIEVADIFEVPLSFFLDPANHQRHSRMANGVTRAYYAMPYGDRYIWGATAGMLLNLYEVLMAPA
jgi:8-oxo-dGTP pyrophosphatase MutT (NUDIX family)